MPEQERPIAVQHRIRRRNDPKPSADAARDHVASGANVRQTQLVYELLISAEYRHKRPVTASELQAESEQPEWYGPKYQSYAILKRLNDLRNDGKVETAPARECPISGRTKTTWRTVRQTKLSLTGTVHGPKGRTTRRDLERMLERARHALGWIRTDESLDSAHKCAEAAIEDIKAIEAGAR